MNKKTMNRLTEVQVRKAKPLEGPYKIPEGGGMYLLVHYNRSSIEGSTTGSADSS